MNRLIIKLESENIFRGVYNNTGYYDLKMLISKTFKKKKIDEMFLTIPLAASNTTVIVTLAG